MKRRAKPDCGERSQIGFSLVELVLSLTVLLIITTLAVPVVLRSLQSYQLNSTASQLSGMLKFTKFEAIRQNLPVSCQVRQQGVYWQVWVDSNGNLQPDNAEPQMLIGGTFTLLAGGAVPNTNSISAALGPGGAGLPWTVLSGANASEAYDHRGVLSYPGSPPAAPSVYALYLGNPNDPTAGYRAIITLPSGAVQVWSAPAGGPWTRVS